MSGSTFTVRLIGGTTTLVLACSCGSGTVTPVSPVAGTTTTNATVSGGVLGVATTSLGPVLVDRSGLTVYLLTTDTPGHSTCSAQCLQQWPLVPAPDGTSIASVQGVSAALSVAKAGSGAWMLTAGGWPLYTYAKDKAPGDVTGQGAKTFGGTWYAVSPSGAAVTAPPAATTGDSGVGGGYGY